MPFTGSHPAAVLPLIGTRLPASALVIGSLIPDLHHYLRLPLTSQEMHSLRGVFGIDLVLGICLFLVWHLVLVRPLVWAAPPSLQRRIPDDMRGGLEGHLSTAGDLGRVSLALVLAGLIHVALDTFTHAGRWGVQYVAALTAPVAGNPLYNWLDLAGSVLGLILLSWWTVRWWRRAPLEGSVVPVHPAARWAVAALLLGTAALATVRAADATMSAAGSVHVTREAVVIASVVAFFSTLAFGVLAVAVVWHAVAALSRRHRSSGRTSPDAVLRQDADAPVEHVSMARIASFAPSDHRRPHSRQPVAARAPSRPRPL